MTKTNGTGLFISGTYKNSWWEISMLDINNVKVKVARIDSKKESVQPVGYYATVEMAVKVLIKKLAIDNHYMTNITEIKDAFKEVDEAVSKQLKGLEL